MDKILPDKGLLVPGIWKKVKMVHLLWDNGKVIWAENIKEVTTVRWGIYAKSGSNKILFYPWQRVHSIEL